MRKKLLTRQVGVLFSYDVYKELIRLTDIKEIPLSQYIREIVEDSIIQYSNTEENTDEK